jgi:hypothetical protein
LFKSSRRGEPIIPYHGYQGILEEKNARDEEIDNKENLAWASGPARRIRLGKPLPPRAVPKSSRFKVQGSKSRTRAGMNFS